MPYTALYIGYGFLDLVDERWEVGGDAAAGDGNTCIAQSRAGDEGKQDFSIFGASRTQPCEAGLPRRVV